MNVRTQPAIRSAAAALVAALFVSCSSGSGSGSAGNGSDGEQIEVSTTSTLVEGGDESATSTTAEPTDEPTTTAAASEPVEQSVAPSEIEIIDAGAEPRIELRYDIADGVYGARISQIQSLVQEIDGEVMSELEGLETLIEVETTSVATDEGYEFSTVYVDAGLGESADPELASAAEAELQRLVGVELVTKVDNRGNLISQAYVPTAGVEEESDIEALMEAASGQTQFIAPLPEEAIGVGGSWKQTQHLLLNGIDIVQETTVTVVAIDGADISLSLTSVQVVTPGPIDFPGLPDTVVMSVESWDVQGNGTLDGDLATPFPALDTSSTGSQVMVGEGSESFRLVQRLDNTTLLTPLQ